MHARLAYGLALLAMAGCGESGVFLGSTGPLSGNSAPDAAGAGGSSGTGGTAGTAGTAGGANATLDAGSAAGAGGGSGADGAIADAGGTGEDAAAGGCPAGSADCDGDPDNGCETDTGSDTSHCGACGNVCPDRGAEVDGAACVSGRCELVCHSFEGYADCDANPDNGCEVNTRRSTSHCGACGNACSTCSNGSCL